MSDFIKRWILAFSAIILVVSLVILLYDGLLWTMTEIGLPEPKAAAGVLTVAVVGGAIMAGVEA